MTNNLINLNEYFLNFSTDIGKDKNDKTKQANYSFSWYFDENVFIDDCQSKNSSGNDIKLPIKMITQSDYISKINLNDLIKSRDDLLNKLKNNHKQLLYKDKNNFLNYSQLKAIANGVTMPISVAEGPPGTGKTHMIIGMIATAIKEIKSYKKSKAKIAVVSNNNTAVMNIIEKIEKFKDSPEKYGDWLNNLSENYASLGNSKIRKQYFEDNYHKFALKSKTDKGFEVNVPFSFTDEKQIIFSTIHSIRKLFKNSKNQDYLYDLVIMDEASQCNVALGMLAYGVAEKIAIIGDSKQLQPIIQEDELNFNKDLPNSLKHLRIMKKIGDQSYPNSILEATLDAFDEPFSQYYNEFYSFLNKHYRCNYHIINYCNKEIYDNKLEIMSKKTDYFPLDVFFYEGDYKENRIKYKNENQKDFSENDKGYKELKTSSVNEKQKEILKYELLDQMIRYIKEGKTICLMSPYKKQVENLYNFLNEEKKLLDIKANVCIEPLGQDKELFSSIKKNEDSEFIYETEKGKFVTIKAESVHKSQGQEFDIVYFFPVADGIWEPPFSQGKNMINVAVSRAVEHLYLITSTKLMTPETVKKLKFEVPFDRPELDEGKFYVTKLIDYIYENTESENFHYSNVKSIFDKIPYMQNNIKKTSVDKKSKKIFATEEIIREYLKNITNDKNNLSLIEECSINRIYKNKNRFGLAYDSYSIAEKLDEKVDLHEKRFDFLLKDKLGRILVIIEVDGEFHRIDIYNENRQLNGDNSCKLQKDRDKEKDNFVEDRNGIVLKNNSKKVWDKKVSENPNFTFALLRLPTDGTTMFETNELKQSCENESISNDFYSIEEILNKIINR